MGCVGWGHGSRIWETVYESHPVVDPLCVLASLGVLCVQKRCAVLCCGTSAGTARVVTELAGTETVYNAWGALLPDAASARKCSDLSRGGLGAFREVGLVLGALRVLRHGKRNFGCEEFFRCSDCLFVSFSL